MSKLFGSKKAHSRQQSKDQDGDSSALEPERCYEKLSDPSAAANHLKGGYDFPSLGLSPPLVASCRAMGFQAPTPVQRAVIPLVLQGKHVMALASTGSGKTAAFVLPILHQLSCDPYSIFAVIVSPTRELALQIHEQVCALGSYSIQVRSSLLTGGKDHVVQTCEITHAQPHIIVATPGRLAYILRGPKSPNVSKVKFVVLDEADRLLSPVGNFEQDIAEILLQTQYKRLHDGTHQKNTRCQTLLFSATMTQSLEQVQTLASAGEQSLSMELVMIDEHLGNIKTTHGDCKPLNHIITDGIVTAARIPSGLVQEYIFMPSRVRDAYLVTVIRNLMFQFRTAEQDHKANSHPIPLPDINLDEEVRDDGQSLIKARSAIIFVPTCEKAARLEALLSELKIDCVALHGLLTQDRRQASLGKFKSHQSRMLIATDVASRGLDIPHVDLVINVELPRNPEDYIHRVGRTARAGRRGLAISLVGERDIGLVHAVENLTARPLEKCERITDKEAIQYLGSVAKASRLAKIKMAEYGFDQLLQKRHAWREKANNDKRKARDAASKAAKKKT